jgi:hypothetical protein
MRADTPFETLHKSLAQATERNLSDIVYQHKQWAKSKEQGVDVFETKKRRPDLYDVTVDMFVQTWGNTACGFGGIAGQAFTSAYTVVVYCIETDEYAVYHAGRFAYKIDVLSRSKEGYAKFKEDLAARNLAGYTDQVRYK